MTARRSTQMWAILVKVVRERRDKFIATLQRQIRWTEEGCALWTGQFRGGRTGAVYPTLKVWYKGKQIQVYVHQIFLMLLTCKPLPVGKETGHYKCFNSACVLHVEPQTVKHNLSLIRHHGKEKGGGDCPF